MAKAGTGELPLDASLGKAIKIGSTKETLAEHIRKGGPVMLPILLLGFTALAIAILKYFQISRIRVATPYHRQHR